MKYAIHTLGCKVNQYESSIIADRLNKAGFECSEDKDVADVLVVNSCTVTENSDKKAKQYITHFRKNNPDSIIVLAGCYPQAFPDDAAGITEVDIVSGSGGKDKIPQMIMEFINNDRKKYVNVPIQPLTYEDFGMVADTDKTRAFVKIEDGCDRFCSYCIIPTARGRVRSRLLSEIVDEVEKQVAFGHKEIVLVGVNLSCYGKDLGLRLVDAVEAVCSVNGVVRVRLSSLEPELITSADIARMAAQTKFCPHFHLSLQSGCDETLARMNRHYNSNEYAEIVANLRQRFDNCSITTDVMVGFAGETDEEFAKSLAFIEKIGFAKVHVFTYSIRQGTAAASRSDHVSQQIKANRYKQMSKLSEKLKQQFLSAQLGTIQTVLVQKRTSDEFANGLTPNYTAVKIYGSNAERHSFVKVEIVGVEGEYCVGKEI